MPVSFLDLAPRRPTATVSIDTDAGPAEYEITGASLTQLAEIGRRYPGFVKAIEGGGGIFAIAEAMPAIVAAGLGHHGDVDYERKAAGLPSAILIELANQIIMLTLPQPRPTPATDEIEAPSAEEVVNGAQPGRTSPLRLSS